MSRRPGPATVTILVLVAAGSAAAQSTAEWRHRYETLSRVSAALADTARRIERLRPPSNPMDTIHVGALVVVSSPSMSGRTRLAADSAWRTLTRFFGDRANAAGKVVLIAQYAGQPEGEIPFGPNEYPIVISGNAGVGGVTGQLVNQLEPVIVSTADQALREWGLNAPSLTTARPSLVYEELSTSPWRTGRECYLGRLDSCRFALGITGRDPVVDWFHAGDRQHYVRRMLSPLAPASLRDACIRDGNDSACVRLMRSWKTSPIAPPFSVHARQLVLALAIETGGAGAFARLLATDSLPLDARLAAASGEPIDSLVSRWRSRVIDARPKTVAADERAAWAAVGWGVLLIALALKSPRWR